MTIIARSGIKALSQFILCLWREAILILENNNMGSVERRSDEVEIGIGQVLEIDIGDLNAEIDFGSGGRFGERGA